MNSLESLGFCPAYGKVKTMQLVEPLMEIAIKTWSGAGNNLMANYCKKLLDDYKRGIGWRGKIKALHEENQ